MWRRVSCLILLAAIGVTALAYDSSVHVDVRWRVLPYQSLTVLGSGGDPALLSLALVAGADATSASGYVEQDDALRFHVASNIPWKLQLRLADPQAAVGLAARRDGGDFVALSSSPLVLASGPHGVYDVTVDFRRPAGSAAEAASAQLIATIMPE